MNIPDHTMLRLIGRGSYGEVWLARNALGTLRAVKVVHRARFDSDRPYKREFAGIQKFEPISRSHEGLVDILHIGRNDDEGFFYYVMELADRQTPINESAHSPSERSASSSLPTPQDSDPETYAPRTLASECAVRGRVPARECLPIFLTLASSLAHLHKHGLLHRDIKPANIIFVGGVAKIADIGLVAEAGEAQTFVGTEGFIPPEGPGTPRADIYALAKTFYEVSTGKDRLEFPSLPLERTQPDENRALVELNAIFLKACARDPVQGYTSADEMHAELALLRSGRSVRHLHVVEHRLWWAKRIGLAMAALALLAVVGLGFASRQARMERVMRERAEHAEFKASLALARAERHSGLAGARWSTLAAVQRAADLVRGSPEFSTALPELRSELITALTLSDIRELRRWPRDMPAKYGPFELRLDESMHWLARLQTNGTASLSKVEGGSEVRQLSLRDDKIRSLGPFSAAGSFIFVMSEKSREWLILRTSDGVVAERSTDPLARSAAIFSPDEHWVAYGCVDGAVEVKDLKGGPLRRWKISAEPITQVAFNSDSRRVAASGAGEDIVILDVVDGSSRQTLKLPDKNPRRINWVGPYLAVSSGQSKLLQIYDLTLPNPSPLTLQGHQSDTSGCAGPAAGDFLLSTSWDNTLRVWELPVGKLRATARIYAQELRFSQDGSRFLIYAEPNFSPVLCEFVTPRTCRRWSERAPAAWKGPLGVSFSPDGKWIAVPAHDAVHVLSSSSAAVVARLPITATRVLFSSDGSQLICGSDLGVVQHAWHFDEQGTLLVGAPSLLTTNDCDGLSGGLHGRVAASRFDYAPEYFDQGRSLGRLENTFYNSIACVSPNGRWAASGQEKQGVRVWDLDTRRLVHTFGRGRMIGYAFSPDSRLLAQNDLDALRVWELESGRNVLEVRWPALVTGQVRLAWSPDQRLIATTLNQYQISLFDAATGELLARLEDADPQFVEFLTFSPDGGQLAVASSTHEVQLWDLRAIRHELAALDLDWPHPPLPPAKSNVVSRIQFRMLSR